MSKKIKEPTPATRLSWGLFWSKNIFRKLEDVRIYFERRRFLLKHGYAPQANWETYYWFIGAMREIFTTLRNNRDGSPMLEGYTEETCHEEWNKILDELIDNLNRMDEENPIYDELDLTERNNKMNEAKDKFFELFSKYFYYFWD